MTEFKSQVGQDKWVCGMLDYKRNGFFVDIGAADGEWLSNTLYLEKELGWTGICVEADKGRYDKLAERRSCACINKAVGKEDGIAEFALSGDILGVKDNLQFPVTGSAGWDTTITLATLLREHDAPKVIDYISLDTEGNDYDVLMGFPFNEYEVLLWTIEHNAYADGGVLRDKIRLLMAEKGYILSLHAQIDENVRIFEDWYINGMFAWLVQP